jgi:hypothetical protein
VLIPKSILEPFGVTGMPSIFCFPGKTLEICIYRLGSQSDTIEQEDEKCIGHVKIDGQRMTCSFQGSRRGLREGYLKWFSGKRESYTHETAGINEWNTSWTKEFYKL